MKEILLFASDKCIETPPIVERLAEAGVEYKLVNITNSMDELRQFLRLRDEDPYFHSVKEKKHIGIPTLVVDGVLYNPYEVEDLSIFK